MQKWPWFPLRVHLVTEIWRVPSRASAASLWGLRWNIVRIRSWEVNEGRHSRSMCRREEDVGVGKRSVVIVNT